jgi:hypothetical protein
MPTILRFDGLKVVIYPNDHPPEHVHVIGSDCEAVFRLHCPEGPVELRESYRFAPRRLRPLAERLSAYLSSLCDEWARLHETDRD